MTYLKEKLNLVGYKTYTVCLPATFGSLAECSYSMFIQIENILQKYETIHFVGHSMGGLIIQKLLDEKEIPNTGRCIFIATPVKGAYLADILTLFPFMDSIFKPLKALKTQEQQGLPRHAPFDIGVIAGTKNNLLTGKPFLSDKSDGRIEVESTKFDKMTDFIELPFGHEEIHHRILTVNQIDSFLKKGCFDHSAYMKIR